jgi:hypothetical protein
MRFLLRPSSMVVAVASLFCAGVLTGGASGAGPTFYVSPPGALIPCGQPPFLFNSIQAAVNAAPAGTTIVVCDGVYNEQVRIDHDLTLAGSGNAVIQPFALSGDMNVVDITAGASVVMSGFTVAGPGPSGCNSIHTGVYVNGRATLDLSNSTVRDIRDTPLSGCQNGEGIRVGTARGSSTPDVGHATIDNVVVTGYQKNGIVVAGLSSTGKITNTTVTGQGQTPVIAENGVEVVDGAAATISTTTMRDNVYTGTQAAKACGLLIIAASGVNDDKTDVYLNDQQNKCTVNGRGGTFEG